MHDIYLDAYDDYLMHHGIKGMKWGVRRYQNKDGSLTSAGKKRYNRKDYVDDKNRFYEEGSKKYTDPKKYKRYTDTRDEAYRIAKKWDLDMDDGGGGKENTPDSERDRYWKLTEKYSKQYDDIFTPEVNSKIGKYVSDKLLDTYGKEGVKQFEKEERRQGILLTAVIGTGVALTAAAPVMVYKGGKWVVKKTAHAIGNAIKK